MTTVGVLQQKDDQLESPTFCPKTVLGYSKNNRWIYGNSLGRGREVKGYRNPGWLRGGGEGEGEFESKSSLKIIST